MKKNSYDITVHGRTIRDFEFIAGPLAALTIPQPPRKPEEFILGAFEGGATPIAGISHLEPDTYIADLKKIKARLGDAYFGANMFAPWTSTLEFIEKFCHLGDESPSFLDLNAIEINYTGILPLLANVPLSIPIYLGINQPFSVYTFRKLLADKAYAFMLERIAAGQLKLYFPNNFGGGHLPILQRNQEQTDWLGALIQELQGLEQEFKLTIPFIVEKGMMTVTDFVNTIVRYAAYPSFAGIRFGSCLLVSKECGLNQGCKDLLATIIRSKKTDRIIPIRSNIIGSKKFKKGRRVRGGVVSYVLATEIAKTIHEIQSEGEDFPQFNRAYNPTVLVEQATTVPDHRICQLCVKDCPREFCEVKGAYDAAAADGDVNQAIVLVSPRIVDIDERYIGAPISFMMQDMIGQTLATIAEKYR
jgi:hypothetical protein